MNTPDLAVSSKRKAVVDRRAFVAALLAQCPHALVIAGLGSPAYDVFAAGDRPGNFYLWGAMGGSTGIALGLALAQPDRSVVAITGDGEQLMGMGSLATVGIKRPSNLTIVVLDNGHFGETGMQKSHSSLGADLSAIARGCGWEDTTAVRDMDAVPSIARRVLAREGCAFVQVFIRTEEVPRALPPRDGVYLKNRFREYLGFGPL